MTENRLVMEHEFYMTLSSNNTTETGNSIALFETQLDRFYELDNDWYVGLAEISYTRSWFNVRKDESVMIVSENEAIYPSSERLKAGFYKDEHELVDEINRIVQEIQIDGVSSYPRIACDIYSHRCITSKGQQGKESLFLWLSDDLADMLGLKFFGPSEHSFIDENGVLRLNSIKVGLLPIRSYDISAGIHSLYVYCDLVEPSFVGDTFSNILRSVNINHTDPFGKDCECIFNPIQYYRLSRSKFQRIGIGLYDDAGEVIPFKFGRTKVVLHFKRHGNWLGSGILP